MFKMEIDILIDKITNFLQFIIDTDHFLCQNCI